MKVDKKIRGAAPFALAGLAAAAGLVLWSKNRVNIPDGAQAVTQFDLDSYLGKWYEIARFDYRFERGLKNVSAFYSRNGDGTIRVDNSGQKAETGKWVESVGKAKFVGDENTARLKVSFFGPFYAGYNVIAIDDNYHHALVAGNDLDYLWLLSRRTVMPDDVLNDYLQKAAAIGYDTDKLIWTEHD